MTYIVASISTTSGTIGGVQCTYDSSGQITVPIYSAAYVPNGDLHVSIPMVPVSVAAGATLTLYLVSQAVFSVSTCNYYGSMTARRVR